MLHYDPRDDNYALYLFDDPGREMAKSELLTDIPRLISESSDVMAMPEFYENIYNNTPAHAEDIHTAIIQCPDVQVVTSNGGKRRKPNTIVTGDMLTLKPQKSFFSFFLDPKK